VIVPLLFAAALAAADPVQCDVRVGRVVDGDTFYSPTLRVASPSVYRVEDTRFRLKDVYAPERGEPRYQQAKTDLADLIWGRMVGVEILQDRDPRGGLIVNVYLCEGDRRVSVNAALRELGWVGFGKGVRGN
jgi:endonuclease YncB( thermonuclease family)